MSLLEQRYRSVLRLLPASYRAEREEEMVDAFMELSGEVPDEANPRPRWGEIASVLSLSLRLRLGGAGAPARFVARGEAGRLVALLLGFHSDVTPRRRSWGASLAPAAAGLAVLGGAWLVVALRPYDVDWPYLWLGFGTTILVWAAGAVVVLARRSSPSWALSTALAWTGARGLPATSGTAPLTSKIGKDPGKEVH